MRRPADLVVDAAGNVCFADTGSHRIRKIDTAGIITIVFGLIFRAPSTWTRPAASTPSGRSRATSRWEPSGRITSLGQNAFSLPVGLDTDPAGVLYVSQQLPGPIVRIDPSGSTTYITGTNQNGFSGDGGPAIRAQLNQAAGLTTDAAGNRHRRLGEQPDPAGVVARRAVDRPRLGLERHRPAEQRRREGRRTGDGVGLEHLRSAGQRLHPDAPPVGDGRHRGSRAGRLRRPAHTLLLSRPFSFWAPKWGL